MNRPIRISVRGAFLILSLAAMPGSAVFAQTDSLAQGAGTQTCKEMYELSASKWKSNRKVAPFYQSWFHGFLSGMNVANFAHVTKRPPFVIGPGDLRERVRAYCDDNPNEDLLTVAVKLYYAREGGSAQ